MDRPSCGAKSPFRMPEVDTSDLMKRVAKTRVERGYFAGAGVGKGEVEAGKDASTVGSDSYGCADFTGKFGFFEDLEGDGNQSR